MRRPRFLVLLSDLLSVQAKSGQTGDEASPVGRIAVLSQEEAHHARQVLRLRPGNLLDLFFQDIQQAYLGRIVEISSKRVTAEIIELLPLASQRQVHLIVGMVKPRRCEVIVEKSVELGVCSLHFFSGMHSQIQLMGLVGEKQLERFKRVRDAAIKQCLANETASIFIHSSLETAVLEVEKLFGNNSIRIVCLPPGRKQDSAPSPTILEVLTPSIGDSSIFEQSFLSPLEKNNQTADISIILGPEGGLALAELELLQRHAYCNASLGPNVLRTETAALLACGIAKLI